MQITAPKSASSPAPFTFTSWPETGLESVKACPACGSTAHCCPPATAAPLVFCQRFGLSLGIDNDKLFLPMTTPRGHVVITGTGRAGTTFLVQLLTNLKLDTGHNAESIREGFDENARAGLEKDIRKDGAPYIVKSTFFCDYVCEVVKREDIRLEHVFVPVRDLHAAVESRKHVTRCAVSKMPLFKWLKHKIIPPKIRGGLVHTRNPWKVEKVLVLQLYNLFLALSEANIPVTLLQFPKLVRDSVYLYEKLKPVLGAISFSEFDSKFCQTVRPELVHDFSKNGS
jgi:hypothetical protein